jgi:hypothetical protein
MRLVLLALAAVFARPAPADACSLSPTPAAHVLGPRSGKPPGRQPWITLWMVNKPIAITQVSATCKADTICKGAAIAFDRTRDLVRLKAPLPAGARIQVVMDGKTLLADVKVSGDPPAPLPMWDGVRWVSAKQEKEGLCSPAGPVVRLAVKPTKASLEAAWLLVYVDKPDPAQPTAKLAYMTGVGGGTEIELGNGLGLPAWLPSVPNKLWFRLVDDNGNLGPVIELP